MRRFIVHRSPFIILFLLWLLFFWRYFVSGPDQVMYPSGDFTYQFFVFRDIAYRSLAAGQLPLWSNCFFAGYPFHADPQSQLFYPPIWISFMLLKLLGWGNFPLFALTLEATLHYLLTSLFTYLFLRAELSNLQPFGFAPRSGTSQDRSPISNLQSPISNLHSTPALLGAVAFTYGGYLTGYPPLQTGILETATWLPLILLSLRRLAALPPETKYAIHDPKGGYALRFTFHVLRSAIPAALLLALSFFAGHPQTFLFVFYLSVAYFIHRAAVNHCPPGLPGRAGWRWSLARLGAALGLFFGLSLIQLLPQAQFLSLSTRASLSFEALSGGFPLGVLVHLLFADYTWSPLYVGVLPFTLALAALAFCFRARDVQPAWRASILFWLAAGAVALILSFGANAAGYAVAYWLAPGYRLFRGQERIALVVSFALAVLAAFGAALALDQSLRSTRLVIRKVAAAALRLLPFSIAVLIVVSALQTAFPEKEGLTTLPARLTLLAFGLGLTVLALYTALSQAIVLRPSSFVHRLSPIVFIAVAVLELFTAAPRSNAVQPFEPYPYDPLLDPLRADPEPFFRIQDDGRMQGHFACGYGFKEWGGISPIRLAAWSAFEARAPESLRWKLMGIKYLITWKNGAITREDELPPAERVAEGPSPAGDPAILAKVYRMFEIPRRAWLVNQARVVNNDEAVYNALRTPGFDPFTTAVLRASTLPKSAQADLALCCRDFQSPGDAGSVTVIEDWPGHLSLTITTDKPALLVISEAYYPGWVATVNGQPAPVIEADAFVLAAPAPAGESTVQLDYQPPLLGWGAVVSLITLAGCVFLSIKKPQIKRITRI